MRPVSSYRLHGSPWDALVGEWEMASPIFSGARGRAVFEWREGGAFLALHSDPPEPAPASVWLIGADDAVEDCAALYTDSRGVSRVYAMRMAGGVWSIRRNAPPFSQRFEAQLDPNGKVMRGTWFSADGEGRWKPDFELVYRRAAAG
jgi:hypothetical protein